MSKKKKPGGLGSIAADSTTPQTTKQQFVSALGKTGTDALSATLASGLGSAIGNFSVPAGILVLLYGHYSKEQSGMFRIAGASLIAYGIAKVFENREAAKSAGVNGLSGQGELIKQRLTRFKDEVLAAYYLDKLFKKKETPPAPPAPAAKSSELDSTETIGEIDLSALDIFEEYNYHQAGEYEREQQQDDYDDEDEAALTAENPSPVFGLYDHNDEPDFSRF